MNKLSAIIFDFDGVLSTGRFYSTLLKTNPELYEQIRTKVFIKDNWNNLAAWMRGEFGYLEFNKRISKILDVQDELLNEELIKSVKGMELNLEMFKLSQDLRGKGVKTAILTDNMDVFTDIFVPHNKLDKKFDFIYSSNTFKKHKRDNNGELMDLAIQNFKVPVEEILYVDDGEKNIEAMSSKGVLSYLYDGNFEKFMDFIKSMFKL